MAAYLKIGDFQGESVDVDHKDWIELTGISQTLGRRGSRGQRSSVYCGGVILTKQMDASTPKLMTAVVNGEEFKEVLIEVCS